MTPGIRIDRGKVGWRLYINGRLYWGMYSTRKAARADAQRALTTKSLLAQLPKETSR